MFVSLRKDDGMSTILVVAAWALPCLAILVLFRRANEGKRP